MFRKALVGEDVEFTQPLRREEAEKDAGDQVEEEEGEKECCDSETKVLKGGADDILESLGIEADSLPGKYLFNAKNFKFFQPGCYLYI